MTTESLPPVAPLSDLPFQDHHLSVTLLTQRAVCPKGASMNMQSLP